MSWITVKDMNIYKKHYHKDIEKKETTLVGIEYANVDLRTEDIESLYSFQKEYVITLKSGQKIEVSEEDFNNVKSLCK